jgi:hypothetical protein
MAYSRELGQDVLILNRCTPLERGLLSGYSPERGAQTWEFVLRGSTQNYSLPRVLLVSACGAGGTAGFAVALVDADRVGWYGETLSRCLLGETVDRTHPCGYGLAFELKRGGSGSAEPSARGSEAP